MALTSQSKLLCGTNLNYIASVYYYIARKMHEGKAQIRHQINHGTDLIMVPIYFMALTYIVASVY